MKCFIHLLAVIALLNLLTTNAFAEDDTPNPAMAEIQKNRAQNLVKEKKWSAARDEALQATLSDPEDRDAWLILGTAQMRLDNYQEALDAFNKYLSLHPSPDKVASMHETIAEVEVRLEQQKKQSKNAEKPAPKN